MESREESCLTPFENLVQFDVGIYLFVYRIGELWRRFHSDGDDNL